MTSRTNRKPQISFGIIVLNGEPFVRYNLRALYPFAHEIIIVEGAYWASAEMATPEGHSKDNTLEELYKFITEEDPRGIVTVITKEGLWNGLTEKCQAWAEKATGNYLWAIDIDEFYRPEDMQKIIDLLASKPSLTALSFKLIQFCFDFNYTLHSGRDFLKHGIMECRRIFKFAPGYQYIQHEPPTVLNADGTNVEKIKYFDSEETSKLGIYIYHYAAIFKSQVESKAKTYALRGWKDKSEYALQFVKNWVSLENPSHLGWEPKYYTWLKKFKGVHPPEIVRLQNDLHSGKLNFELRNNTDVEYLISSSIYKCKVIYFFIWEYGRFLVNTINFLSRTTVRKTLNWLTQN